MSVPINDVQIRELSLIFGEHKGGKWAPVNGDARVLSVKGKPTAMGRFVEGLKGYFSQNGGPAWPVSTDVADGFDNDGDGAADYNALASAFCSCYYDLQNAYGISDDAARSLAIKSIFDEFLSQLADFRGTTKAGARHNAKDAAAIDAIKAAHDKLSAQHGKMGKQLAAVADNLTNLGAGTAAPAADADPANDDTQKAQAALVAFVPGILGDDGYPANMAEYRALSEKAKKKDDKPYGDVAYADPENGKYPIDTEEHAKAAWAYINKEKNAAEYSAEDLKKVKDKIIAACEKFGITIDEAKKADEVAPLVVDAQAAVASALEAQQATFKAALDEAIADARKAADEQVAAAKAQVEAANASVAELTQSVKALVDDARKPTGASTGENVVPRAKAAEIVKGKNTLNGTLALLAAGR